MKIVVCVKQVAVLGDEIELVADGRDDYFVRAGPKDVTMYEDAIKTSGHQGALELSELVLDALDTVAGELRPLAADATP